MNRAADRQAHIDTLVERTFHVAEAETRIAAAAATPALDVADLYITFVMDADAAYAQLSTLSGPQLVCQAIAMTSYLNEILNGHYQTEAILARWETALIRRTMKEAA